MEDELRKELQFLDFKEYQGLIYFWQLYTI
jgi:hypothetical protein